MNAELLEEWRRIGEHVHQMRDGRALIAADVSDAGLQQRFGDRENAFAVEHVAGTEAEALHLSRE